MLSKSSRLLNQMRAKEALNLMNESKYKEAIVLYTKAIALDSTDWRLFLNRAECFQHLNQLSEALTDANTAVHLADNQMVAHYRKGCVLLNAKHFRSAEKSFKAALSCHPNDENSKRKLTETLQLFIKECGFTTDQEINHLSQRFSSCSEFCDALISGLLCDVNHCRKESSDCYESELQIPDESDLMRSVSISNEIYFDYNKEEDKDNNSLIPLINSTNSSFNHLNSITGNGVINDDLIRCITPEKGAIDANDGNNDFRLPKSVPLFRTTNKDLKTNIESKTIPKIPQVFPQITNDLMLKKIVKTRPVIRRSFVN